MERRSEDDLQIGRVAELRKEKRNNNQNGFFFPLGEGAISQSQRKMMACDAVARVPHQCLSARASKTQQ